VVTVPVASDVAFAEVVRRLAAAGVTASELSLHLPSLDEVFFLLTGRDGSHDTEQAGTPDPGAAGPTDSGPTDSVLTNSVPTDSGPTNEKAMASR
jgi:hypothetical protein